MRRPPGRREAFRVQESTMRVVSLLPSATEILCHLDAKDMLVGRSHECDSPDGLASIPVLTAQRTGPMAAGGALPHADPAAIDGQVRALLSQKQSLYHLNTELLATLRPDLILTQDLCEVCSIDLRAVERAVADMAARGQSRPRVLSLNSHTVEDVIDDLLRVGDAIGRPEVATRKTVALQERLLAAQNHVNPFDEGPVVGFLEWTDPLFVAGHWTVQLIERAGGRHPLNPTVAPAEFGAAAGLQQGARRAGKSIAVTPEVLAATRPDWLVIAPCGLDLEAAWSCMQTLARQEWFRALPAARDARVAVVDGNKMFNRPGPRLVEAFEWLVSWLQNRPELSPPGFPVRVWNHET